MLLSKYRKLYRENRLWNINGNIVIAGLLGTSLAVYPVYLTNQIVMSNFLAVILSFFIDAGLDFIIFVCLHLFVHRQHFKKYKPSKELVRDTYRIQMQRVYLSFIYFFIAVGGHYLLIENGLGRATAFFVSYIFALFLTRTIHTIHGKKKGLFEPIKSK